MSRLRRPFLSDRYFFITVRLLKGRGRLRDADFRQLALALNRARRQHPFYVNGLGFPSRPLARHLRARLSADHFAGHEIRQDQLDHGQSPGEPTSFRSTGLLCM